MNFYILFFTLLTLLHLSNFNISYQLKKKALSLLFLYLVIFIGLRHQVGGDWITYENDFYNYIKEFNIYNFSYKRDFAYEFISYIVYNFNLSVHFVNLLCSFIFLYAIFSLGKEYNNYLIIILISFPYLITVGAMGYTKQSTAFALIVLAFLSLKKNCNIKFLFYATLAIFFHKSAIAIVGLLFISKLNLNIKYLSIFFILLLLSYFTLLFDKSRILSYLQSNSYKSEGVFIRIIINLIPSFIYIFYYKLLNFNLFEKKFILLNILCTFACLFFAFNYSTFVDRFLFYFAIIQILVYPNFIKLKNNSFNVRLIIIAFYFSLLIGWLVFSNHSIKWVPYQNLIFLNE